MNTISLRFTLGFMVPGFQDCHVLIVVRVMSCWVLEFWGLGGCHSYQVIMVIRLPAFGNSEKRMSKSEQHKS